mmetsp:Transcript_25884/g.38235  ORF Transcript_25884/g.38235 Transcript_25884/m.38235 type:complete len:257 (-) Transcript_25884:94-864(-)
MCQTKTVTNLMTHGKLSFVSIGIEQIIFIHFRHTRLNLLIHCVLQDFINAQPSTVAIISVAYLHDTIHNATGMVYGHVLSHQRQGVRCSRFPIVHRHGKFTEPRVVQGHLQFQREALALVGPVGTVHVAVAGSLSCERIIIKQSSEVAGDVVQYIGKITKVKIGKVQITQVFTKTGSEIFNFIKGGLTEEKPKTYRGNRHYCHADDPVQETATATNGILVHIIIVIVGILDKQKEGECQRRSNVLLLSREAQMSYR